MTTVDKAVASTSSNRESVAAPYFWQTPVWQRLLAQYQTGHLAHAYLVTGESGLGKLQLIQLFARFLLCQNPDLDVPCGNCVNCQLGANGFHPDILLIHPEEGRRDIKIDQIRALSEFIARTSHSGIRKLVIINQAHNLNASAANSLLKTLEEPSGDTHLFLLTARAESLPATLRSRCQLLLVPTPGLGETSLWLREQGISDAEAGSLALAAGHRPLYAMHLAESDGVGNLNEFKSSLIGVVQRSQSIQSAVALAQKLGEALAVEYLLRVSSIVIRGMFVSEAEQDSQLSALIRSFAATENRMILVQRLAHFNLVTEHALRQLRSSANPNAQLLVESLLWQWSLLRVSGSSH